MERGVASTDGAAAATARILDLADAPTALLTGNNLATIGAMRALRDRGLRVPWDVSLVGIDDFEWADCFEPRLTLMAQPCAEIGRQAAALLVERIERSGWPASQGGAAAQLTVRASVRRLQ